MQKRALSKAHAISPSECAIVIVAWNCWEHLCRCLDALSAQTISGFRVVIVDNGDAEDQQIERASSYPKVSYVKSCSNLGFAAGNNRGIEIAQGAGWIILLNPDTLPAVDWFEKMMEAAVQYPEFAVFGSRLLKADNPRVLDGEGDCYHVSGMVWRSGMGLAARGKPDEPWEVFSPCAAAALYKSDALRQVGGFDEDFFCYMEDVDVGFRLRLAGYRCMTVSGAEVLHVGSATTGKRSDFYVYYGQRNLVWTYVKNMPGILFWLFLPLHFVLNIAAIILLLFRRQGILAVKAKWNAIEGIPKMWHKRKIIQFSRKVSIWQIWKMLSVKIS
jgi:GT2 family glycosyltransferase